MWLAVKAFFSDNMAALIKWLAITAAAALAILKIFNAGKKSEQVDELKSTVDKVGSAHAIENKNSATLGDGDAVVKLRDQWGR